MLDRNKLDAWITKEPEYEEEVHLLFADKANRDKKFKDLQSHGYTNIKRYTSRNQLLHPNYIEDVPNGNMGDYKTIWGVLYGIRNKYPGE